MIRLLSMTSPRAWVLGRYPLRSMACRILLRVDSLIRGLLLKTSETVLWETPHSLATSVMVMRLVMLSPRRTALRLKL